jgi:hypothetical protein
MYMCYVLFLHACVSIANIFISICIGLGPLQLVLE